MDKRVLTGKQRLCRLRGHDWKEFEARAGVPFCFVDVCAKCGEHRNCPRGTIRTISAEFKGFLWQYMVVADGAGGCWDDHPYGFDSKHFHCIFPAPRDTAQRDEQDAIEQARWRASFPWMFERIERVTQNPN